MRINAIAADYDDIIVQNGKVNVKTLNSLIRFRQTGRKLILITGRILDELETIFSRIDIFDAVVAENGAVVHIPETGEITELTSFNPDGFLEMLRNRGVKKLKKGRIITATMRIWEEEVREVIMKNELDLEMITNRDSLMILPRGTDKASGLRAAAVCLGIKEDETAGIGDAENDITFLRVCGLAGAVSNAVQAVKGNVNFIAASPYGHGVIEFLTYISDNDK